MLDGSNMKKHRIKLGSVTLLDEDGNPIFTFKGEQVKEFNVIIEKGHQKGIPLSWIGKLDANKETIVHQQNIIDVEKFFKKNLQGYKIWIGLIPPRPKSSQSDSKSKYEEYLKDFFEKRKERIQKTLAEFPSLLIYICCYLSKERFATNVDNLPKPLIDSVKKYFGGDRKVYTLIVEKKQLFDEYDSKLLPLLENSLMIIADAKIRDDIVKI